MIDCRDRISGSDVRDLRWSGAEISARKRVFVMSKVWPITGSSRGLGGDLAKAVLAAGHRLVATARQPEDLHDLASQYGDQVRVVALDVTDPAAARAAVAPAI